MSTILSRGPSTRVAVDAPPSAKGRQAQLAGIGSLIVATVAAVYFLLPIWMLFSQATKSLTELNQTSPLTLGGALLSNIGALFQEDNGIFFRWILNTILYAVVGGGLSTILAAMAGYAMDKYEFPGKNGLYSLVLAGVLVPGGMLALPLFLLFSSVGLTNTVWSVLIPTLVSPFGVYMGRIFSKASVPNELLESGRLDGAGELRMFFTMSIRLMSPGLITVFLFSFVATWNNFMLPLLMLQDEKNYPVMLGIVAWSGSVGLNPRLQSLVIVGCLVSVVPVIVMFLTMQRYWRSGLSAGAVKS